MPTSESTIMAASRKSRQACIPAGADTATKLTQAEFWQLMQHEDKDYVDLDFAGMIDWPSAKVEHRVAAELGPGLYRHHLIEGTQVRLQQSEVNSDPSPSEHSSERTLSATSPEDHSKQRRSRAIRPEDEDEDDSTYEGIAQFYLHFEGDETDQVDPAWDHASLRSPSLDSGRSDDQRQAHRSESAFGTCYNRPLTVNDFHDRRPPPGFNLLHSVQQSVAEYNKTLGVTQSSMRTASSVKHCPTSASSQATTLASVTSIPSKSASSHRPAAKYQGQTPTPKATSRTAVADERIRRDSENAQAGVTNPRGRFTSQIRGGDVEDVSTRKPPNTDSMGSHRQFKPTARKPRRRR